MCLFPQGKNPNTPKPIDVDFVKLHYQWVSLAYEDTLGKICLNTHALIGVTSII